jgi:hypothetical protein
MRNSDLFEIVDHRGYYRCAGVGGGITGMGCDFGLIDDPIKNAEEAHSEVFREKVWEWYISTFRTRSRNVAAAAHHDALARGRSRRPAAAAGEIERRTRTSGRSSTSPRSASSTSTAIPPGRRGAVARLVSDRGARAVRALSAYQFAALFQQRPAPAEGGIVKRAWFKYYRELPELDEIIISADLSFKETKDSDFVSIQVWGRKGANRYLIYRRPSPD